MNRKYFILSEIYCIIINSSVTIVKKKGALHRALIYYTQIINALKKIFLQLAVTMLQPKNHINDKILVIHGQPHDPLARVRQNRWTVVTPKVNGLFSDFYVEPFPRIFHRTPSPWRASQRYYLSIEGALRFISSRSRNQIEGGRRSVLPSWRTFPPFNRATLFNRVTKELGCVPSSMRTREESVPDALTMADGIK